MTATPHASTVLPAIPACVAWGLPQDDEEIAKRVRLALGRELGRGADAITFRVHGGVVTLGGCVSWPYQIGMAERCVCTVDGVVSVVNELRNRDDIVSQRIRSAVEIALEIRDSSWIEVNVRPDGTAILYGMVRNAADRQKAGEVAANLSNGFAVQNRLCVS